MSIELRILLLIAAIFSVGWIITRIRKARVRLEDTFFWVVTASILFVLGMFPQISFWLASRIGIQSPANLVFLIMICLLFEKVFTMSIIHSQMEDKYVIMTAEIALRCKNLEEQINKLEKQIEKLEKDKNNEAK